MVIRAHMGRIAEENVGFFPLRKSPDFGVFLFEPLLHQRLVVFQRTMQRLLAGDTKLRQKSTNRDRAQRNIESIFDKFCYHFARPEGKRKLKLQWVLLRHGVVNPFQLLAVEFRRAPKQGFGLQRTPTSPSILGQPTVHRRTIDTDNASYHFWTFAVLNTADRALAHRLQSAVVKASGIVRLHDSRESYSLHPVKGSLPTYEQINIGDQHPVEVDEALVGGRTRGEGRGNHHKTTVVGAIEVRTRRPAAEGKKQKRIIYAGRLRLRLVQDRGAKELTKFVQENVANGAVVRTDGWKAYDDLQMLGYTHEPLVLDGDPERTEAHLPMIHIAFSNLKTWLLGTHHGVSPHHLQAYLNEFVFRFNRRFYPMTAFNSALGLAAHASAPTYRNLYSGDWTHPAS